MSQLALPAGPPPAARRQRLVGTAVACAAGATLIGGMLALWAKLRGVGLAESNTWVPKGVHIPEVPTNTMLLAFIPACLFAQWAVYSAKRGDRTHAGLALFLVALIGVAIVNGQAFVYSQMELPASGASAYHAMFYAVTGTMTVLLILGIGYSLVAAFRYLGGRTSTEVVSGHAIYWYFLAVAFAAVWFVVYVKK